MEYDLLVRRGRVVDGSGLPSYVADVGVKDGKVVEVGRLNGSAARTIDADGLAVASGGMKEVDLGGRQVLLAFVDGKYFAFARQCPHEEADLKTGALEGARVRCSNHSYCFDLRTGECLVPQGGPPLTVLPTEERGEEICIRLEW